MIGDNNIFKDFSMSNPIHIENFFDTLIKRDFSTEYVDIVEYYSEKLMRYFKSDFLFELNELLAYVDNETGEEKVLVEGVDFSNIYITFHFCNSKKRIYRYHEYNFNNVNFILSIEVKKIKHLRKLLMEAIKNTEIKTVEDSNLG